MEYKKYCKFTVNPIKKHLKDTKRLKGFQVFQFKRILNQKLHYRFYKPY